MVSNIKVIVLDFDNTIVLNPTTREGSQEVKAKVWEEVFKEFEKSDIERIKNEVIENEGGRTEMIRSALLELGRNGSITNAEISRREDLFEERVQEGIENIGVSDECIKFLEKYSKLYPIYINTVTPVNCAKKSLKNLGVDAFFKDVYGGPKSKKKNLIDIAKAESVKHEHVLFVDDSPKSCEIAESLGVKFIGMHTNAYADWYEKRSNVSVVKSFEEISIN